MSSGFIALCRCFLSRLLHSLLLGKRLRSVDQSSLGVLSSVDEVGVVEGQLDRSVDNIVDRFHAQHERVVLIADLVAPAAEAATRPDVLLLQLRQQLGEGTLALQGWSRVAVVEAAVVGGDDLVVGPEHLGVDETLDGLGQDGLLVDGLQRRLGDLQHDGPVRTLLRLGVLRLGAVGQLQSGQLLGRVGLVVGGVVGEDGGPVEGAVILGEVEL